MNTLETHTKHSLISLGANCDLQCLNPLFVSYETSRMLSDNCHIWRKGKKKNYLSFFLKTWLKQGVHNEQFPILPCTAVVYQQEDGVHPVLYVSKCRATGFAEFGQGEKSVTINQDGIPLRIQQQIHFHQGFLIEGWPPKGSFFCYVNIQCKPWCRLQVTTHSLCNCTETVLISL